MATACFGSQASSPTCSESFWPKSPPCALTSMTAIVAPRRICSPTAASEPVIGPAMAILISACAPSAQKSARASARRADFNIMESIFLRLCRIAIRFRRRGARVLDVMLQERQGLELNIGQHLARFLHGLAGMFEHAVHALLAECRPPFVGAARGLRGSFVDRPGELEHHGLLVPEHRLQPLHQPPMSIH